ncbi:MAG: WD40 repeat domain-containing serine/threonine-protein kinase [Candidatus Eremiobacterota bacterium]
MDDLTLAQSPQQRDVARDASSLEQPAAPELPGYRLDRLLGQGSFGEVWAGVQQRTGQKVAVKVLSRREGLDWLYFKHEVGRLREVAEHPYIVGLIDADLSYDPPHFVMPLLSQGSLAQARDRVRGLSVHQAVRWIRHIATALKFTHDKGLLHCDLKPSNVLLDEQDHVRLVDFGQARGRTDTTVTYGTLGFMAPEQASLGGEVLPSVRWDVYSLGATAYWILTGDCPRLSDADRTELTRTEDTARRLKQYRELLSSRPLAPVRRLNPKVDRDLASIVEACLVLEPDKRTGSVAEVLEDLQRRQERLPLLCRRPWSLTYRFACFCRRPMALTLLLILLMLGGSAYGLWWFKQASLAQTEYDRGLVSEERGDLAEAALWWAQAMDDQPPFFQEGSNWALRFKGGLPWRLEAVLPGPEAPKGRVAFSPDGKYLAGSYHKGMVQIVPLPANMELEQDTIQVRGATYPLTGGAEVTRLEFAGDRHLCVGGEDGRLRIFTLGQGVDRPVVVELKGEVTALAATAERVAAGTSEGQLWVGKPDGRAVLTRDLGAAVKCVDIHADLVAVGRDDGRLEVLGGPALPPLESSIQDVRFSPDGKDLYASLPGDTSVHHYQLSIQTPEPVRRPAPATDLLLSPSGDLAALWLEDTMLIQDTDNGELQVAGLDLTNDVETAAFSQDGLLIAVATTDFQVSIFDCDTGRALTPPLRTGSRVAALAFAPDRRLAVLSDDGITRVWAPSGDPAGLLRLNHDGVTVRELAYAPDGTQLATLAGKTLRLFPLGGGEIVLRDQPGRLITLAYSRDGSTLAIGLDGGRLGLLDRQGNTLRQVELPGTPTGLAFHPRGEVLAAVLQGPDALCLIHPRSGKLLQKRPAVASQIAFSPRGWPLAVAGPGVTTLWGPNLTGAKELKQPTTAQVEGIAFGPDGSFLVTAGKDGHGFRWDPSTGQQRGPEYAGEPTPHEVRISPDGGTVGLPCEDRTARLFDAADGQPRLPLLHRGAVLSLDFSSDSRWAATGSSDGTLRIWDTRTGSPLTVGLSPLDTLPLEAQQAALDTGVQQVRFHPLRRQLAAAWGDEVLLWDLSPEDSSPERYRLWTEVDSGLRLDEGHVRPLTPLEWIQAQQELERIEQLR